MNEELLGKDLKLVDKEIGSDLNISPSGDLEIVSGAYNLGQAIVNRLRTRVGELADLGHSRYGSRLYQLVGEPNNERTRELARLYAMESIAQDPRVKEILSVAVEASKDDPRLINISVSFLPIGSATALNIVFPFYLEVG
jgi:phage baseplate assembly protein W